MREEERQEIAVVREFYPDTAAKSGTEIQRMFQSSEAYKILQPTVKKWINSNTENYQPDGPRRRNFFAVKSLSSEQNTLAS